MKIQPIRQPWPGTMTGRERFRRQMNSQGVDRCFNMEFGYWDENFTEWKMFRDNGIFRGVPVTDEQRILSDIARDIYEKHPTDGKYILDGDRLIICQSHASTEALQHEYPEAEVNPLGDWLGGTSVDTGATNRKLGSDMADSITGGGLHGKDLTKADVSVNIYAWLKAQRDEVPVELSCAIGDAMVDGRPYREIMDIARDFIRQIGGFERFAEWGLV